MSFRPATLGPGRHPGSQPGGHWNSFSGDDGSTANPAGYIERLETISAAGWQGREPREREWLVNDIVPMRNLTLVTGDGGTGKTLLALQLQASAALGRPWLGVPCARVKTLGVYAEDDEDELHRRFASICGAYGADLGDLEHVELAARVGEDNTLITFDPRDNNSGDATPLYTSILRRAKETGAQLIILDSLYDFFSGNENIRAHVHRFGTMLRRLAVAINGAVVLCGHPSRAGMSAGDGLSGSTAWNALPRSRLYLTRPEGEDGRSDPDARLLKIMKANYGPAAKAIDLRWRDGVFTAYGEDYSFVGKLDRQAQARMADDIFLACLKIAKSQGRLVTDAVNSPRYAPKVFAAMPASKPFSVAQLRASMERLFAAGRIIVGSETGPDRHPTKAIVEVLT